jgi:ubiquinol-cytochrome c reductase cytochrome b subunit
MFDPNVKIGALMHNAMDKGEAKKWFGAAPPDLTLVSRARQPEWLYTYLLYILSRRHPSLRCQQQGVQGRRDAPRHCWSCRVCRNARRVPVLAHNGGVKRDPLTGEDILDDPCGRFAIPFAGAMPPQEYRWCGLRFGKFSRLCC